jgi:hypothetical protein
MSLPSGKKLALGKEIFVKCFFLCREFFIWLSAKKRLCRVFFLCREFYISLSAKPSLPRVFYFALGT